MASHSSDLNANAAAGAKASSAISVFLFDLGELYGVCGVALRDLRVDVRLHEDAVHACRDRRARERRRILPVAARTSAEAARPLHRVRRVHHHRIAELAHDEKRAHVGDEVVVAEAGAPLAEDYAPVAGRLDLPHHLRHVLRRHELALLDVHDRAGLAGGDDEVGLPREERRDLQHVAHLRDDPALPRLVDVGKHRDVELRAYLGEYLKPLLDAGAAVGVDARAVRLVEARLEDVADLELPRKGGKPLREVKGHLTRLDDAWTRDENEPAVAERDTFVDRYLLHAHIIPKFKANV